MTTPITRKLLTQYYVTSASTYVGEPGTIFFDPDTTTLRFGDGTTPGGNVGAAGSALLLESGGSSTISALPGGGGLDGTELYVAVQSGSDIQITGNDLGSLILTNSFSSNPLDAPGGSGNSGNDAAFVGGAGDGASSGGQFLAQAGQGGITGPGGQVTLVGGTGGTGQNGGSIFLEIGLGGAGNGLLVITTSNGTGPGLPTTDPASAQAVWEDNGSLVMSGNPTHAVATVASGSAVSLSTTVAKDVTTVVVGNAGTYWLSGVVYFTGNSTTTVTSCAASVGTGINAINTTVGQFGTLYLAGVTVATIGQDISVVLLGVEVTATAGETFHLCAKAAFGISTLSAYGEIMAVPIL